MKHLLSPRELATAIGVSESTLKRWTDDGLINATRTAGGHRRIPLAEAIRFVRATRTRVVNPTILQLGDLPGLEATANGNGMDRVEQVHRALEEGAEMPLRGLVTSFFLDGMPMSELCDGLLTPAMHRIGELWRSRKDGVFVEHRATDLCIHLLNHLRSLIEVPEDAPVAVGGGPSGDPYLLASLMAATCLADAGIRAVNLGADTPAEAFEHALDAHDARLAWLSLSAPVAAPLMQEILDLARRLERRDAFLVLGGRSAGRPDLAQGGNIHVGRDMGELVAFARGLLATHAARSPRPPESA